MNFIRDFFRQLQISSRASIDSVGDSINSTSVVSREAASAINDRLNPLRIIERLYAVYAFDIAVHGPDNNDQFTLADPISMTAEAHDVPEQAVKACRWA